MIIIIIISTSLPQAHSKIYKTTPSALEHFFNEPNTAEVKPVKTRITGNSSLVPRLSNYCTVMRGREREPGIHCKFMRLISREFYGFVNSPYSSVNDDASARSLVYSLVYTTDYSEEAMPALRTLPTVFATLCHSYGCQI